MKISAVLYGAARRHFGGIATDRDPSNTRPRPRAFGTAFLLLGALCACTPKSAQEKGAEMAGEKIDMMTGIGDALTSKGGKAAESIATGVGSMVEGVERGTMKAGRKVSVDSSLAAAGLTVTKVQDSTDTGADAAHSMQTYVIAKGAVDGSLRMFAYDALSREIGRSSVPVSLSNDEAKYVGLPLDKQIELNGIAKVAFTFVPKVPAAAR